MTKKFYCETEIRLSLMLDECDNYEFWYAEDDYGHKAIGYNPSEALFNLQLDIFETYFELVLR